MAVGRVPLESEEAQVLVTWLQVRGINFTHTPNETGHDPYSRRRAIRMKQQGTSKGFPDYAIFIEPSLSVNGRGFVLYIELKRIKGGSVSPEQRAWIDTINSLDEHAVAAYVCNGAQAAIDLIGKYLRPAAKLQII